MYPEQKQNKRDKANPKRRNQPGHPVPTKQQASGIEKKNGDSCKYYNRNKASKQVVSSDIYPSKQ